MLISIGGRMAHTNHLSYVSGTSGKPLLYQTIGAALDQAAILYGDNEAVVSVQQGVRLTYADLNNRVNACANGLLHMGLQAGDRVGIWSPNRVEWMIAQYATAKIGAILVTINPAYRVHELEYVLNLVGCRCLILAESFKSSDYIDMLGTLTPALTSAVAGDAASRVPSLEHAIVIGTAPAGMCSFAEIEAKGAADDHTRLQAIAQLLQPEDAINIQFTSGTTGSPKGATLSHHNILNNGFFVGEGIELTPQDRICVQVPLYHCFGMVMGNLGALTHGACVVYPSEGFDPDASLDVITGERCTALYGVPTMFIAMLASEKFAATDCSTLRTGIMAGSPCPIETMKQVITDMRMSGVTICYGMTETSPVSFQSSTSDPIERRVSTLGKVHPHLEVKIIDADGKTVARGETGELCTRGYSVMQGYWGDADKTAAVIDHMGWMHTGDLAVIDDEGYANIVGRSKDMIIRGGENIYPREIEDFLFTHPDILEAAVFGVPDDRFGEAVACWLRVRAGAKLADTDIRAFCTGQIAHYKVPHYVEFVDDFPMTVTGKIQKFIMAENMIKQLGLKRAKTA